MYLLGEETKTFASSAIRIELKQKNYRRARFLFQTRINFNSQTDEHCDHEALRRFAESLEYLPPINFNFRQKNGWKIMNILFSSIDRIEQPIYIISELFRFLFFRFCSSQSSERRIKLSGTTTFEVESGCYS